LNKGIILLMGGIGKSIVFGGRHIGAVSIYDNERMGELGWTLNK